MFVGIGVGPGDPELITVKAKKYIEQADVICFLQNQQGQSQAKQICACYIQHNTKAELLGISMPMALDRQEANRVYDHAAKQILQRVQQEQCVVFLCEGDPLFFGSFAYLLERIQGHTDTLVIPGIASPMAAAAQLQSPLVKLSQSLVVLSSRHSDAQILARLADTDTVVIMKSGRHRQRLIALIAESGRSKQAQYLEYISRENQRIVNDLDQLDTSSGPYFSLFVVTQSDPIL